MPLSLSGVTAQVKAPKDTTAYIYDTVGKTLCLYVIDSVSGASKTGYLHWVTASKMELRPPADAKPTDSVVVLKQVKVPVSEAYYDWESWAPRVALFNFKLDLTKKEQLPIKPSERHKVVANKSKK